MMPPSQQARVFPVPLPEFNLKDCADGSRRDVAFIKSQLDPADWPDDNIVGVLRYRNPTLANIDVAGVQMIYMWICETMVRLDEYLGRMIPLDVVRMTRLSLEADLQMAKSKGLVRLQLPVSTVNKPSISICIAFI